MTADLRWRRTAVAFALTVAAGAAMAEAPAMPPDVAQFVARRDPCDHFRGEEAYDAQRARFLAKQAARHCAGTDRALAALKRRHRHDARVTKFLAGYEASIERR